MKTPLQFGKPPSFPEIEESILNEWHENKAFERSVEQRPADKAYVFYDGPPFATGMPHYGHLLASTTKDVVPRYWAMKGYRVERVWGWDCHGLPIENMLEKQLGIKGGKKGIEALGIATFNQACRSEVLRLDKEWERIIGRLGRWVDFKNSYKTMDASFMESVWWGFKQLYEKGLVYEGRKVILFCPRCSTPLSNFEIAMDNSYLEVTEPGTTYKYAVVGQESTFLLAWSTTPWNKIATPALAVNPDLLYVKVKQGAEYYILAESRVSELKTDVPYEVLESLTGQELSAVKFTPHYNFYPPANNEKSGVVVADAFVTADDGTGIVTLAAYGEDDYRVMKDQGIQIIEHVDDQGKLNAEVTPWAGQYLLKVNPLVDADLSERNLVYKQEAHTHTVATCYRCGTRLYHAPLPAWFINIAQLRADLLALNENINWVPEHLKHGRFMKGLETAPDWNISRSRYWGTPMPIWAADGNSDALVNHALHRQYRVIGSVAELQEWAVIPEEAAKITDIHREFIDDIELWIDDARSIKGRRVKEVFDCWVESGSMPFASQHYPFENKDTFEARYPAQFVSEYIAQTRAWFYTMHVMSTALFKKEPFENVLTTGTILGDDGTKMSKSKKNYPDPEILMNTYGVDTLRMYMMSSTVMKGENLVFSEKDVSDIRRKVFVVWWNIVAFYQSFADTTVETVNTPKEPTHIMDRWLLAELEALVNELTLEMDSYDVVKVSRRLMSFIDLFSTWYLRLSRERIKATDNAQVSQVFGHTLRVLAQLFAPFAPFFSEVVFQTVTKTSSSVHHSDWPLTEEYQVTANVELLSQMRLIKEVVEKGHAQRAEAGIKVRQPLARVTVQAATDLSAEKELLAVLAAELNVKEVTWQMGKSEVTVTLSTELTPELKAEGEAREIMRLLQNLRKKEGLTPDTRVTVQLPTWPTEWTSEIERKTNCTLLKGDDVTIVK
ncbi:MAG: isoleucine--tRNA ligase [bacterium]|nr:isoleucine--tRNA ligase [bacterium]